MVINLVVHDNCNDEVVGVILSTFKHRLDDECFIGEIQDNTKPVIAIFIGNTFNEIHKLATCEEILKNLRIEHRMGIIIKDISEPLTEMDMFKIFTLDSIDTIISEIKGILNATKKQN